MGMMEGPISDRLRKKYKKDAPEWHPGRPADVEAKKGEVPEHVDGTQLTGRKYVGKHHK